MIDFSDYLDEETCTNYEVINGTALGQFVCPLIGFPKKAGHCCGTYGKQFCCIHESNRFDRSINLLYRVHIHSFGGLVHGAPNLKWLLLLMPLVHVIAFLRVHG